MFGTDIRFSVVTVAAALTILISILALACSSQEAPRQPEEPLSAMAAAPALPVSDTMPTEPAPPQKPLPAAPANTPAPAPTRTAEAAASSNTPTGPAEFRLVSTPEPTPIPVEFPVVVTDGNGREITFDRPPERIVAFSSAVVEILFAIGHGHRIAATHSFVSYPPEAESIPRVGDAFSLDLEAVIALEPDLVYMFFDRFNEDLERAGLKTLYMPTLTDDFTQVSERIRMWGRIVGDPNAAELAAVEFEERVQRIEDVMSPYGAGPVVFQNTGEYWTPGQGTLMQEVFDLLRLENAAADIEGYAQLSPEIIIEKDPSLIITSNPDELMNDPAFAKVSAVRNGAVYSLSSDALSIPAPRFVEGVEELARLAYPILFDK